MSSRTGRFNLLLLEDGEYYLEDVIVSYAPIPPGKGVKFARVWARRQKGRLKLCTHSVFFVPNDVAQPISKFCFRRIDEIIQASSLFSDADASAALVIQAQEVLQMKADNEVGPYKVVTCDDSMAHPKRHLIALVHTDLKVFLDRLKRLYGYVSQGNEAALHRNVISERHVTKFDISNLADYTERPLLKKVPLVSRVSPMINCPGCLNLTDSYLYFQPADINNIQKERITKFALGSILRLYKRRYMLRQCALELVMEDGQSILFVFNEIEDRDEVHDVIIEQPRLVLLERQQSPLFMNQQLIRWQRGEIDNFEYLMHLNSAADRSFNDLTQYPVMPWVLADYKSAELDLDDPATFRDLSKPIGALNPQRLKRLLDRFREMPKNEHPPPFLYGTHYSTPGYVLNFLVREVPEYMLCLQNGKFDSPDRLFVGIEDCWRGVLTNPSDVKELIPQFYDTDDMAGVPGRFLRNSDNLDLGRRQNGERVGDVALPPWARSATDFVRKMREALESDYVSEHLHEWIDLIFGYKQTGKEAERAHNLFYYMTYEGAIDIDAIQDPMERKSIEQQIQEFGQTPKQIFSQPHPARNAASQGAHTGLLVAAMHGGADVADEGRKSPPTSAGAANVHSRGRISPESVSSGKASPGESTEAASIDYSALGGAKALARANATCGVDLRQPFSVRCHRQAVTAVAIAPVGKTEKTSKIADLSIITTSEDGSCYVESIGSIKKHAREVAEARSEAQFASGGKGGLGRSRADDDDDDDDDPGPHVNESHIRVNAVMLDDQHRFRLESGLAISCAEVIPDAVTSKLVVGSWDGSISILSLDKVAAASRHAASLSIGDYHDEGGEPDDAAVVAATRPGAHADAISCMCLHSGQCAVVTGSWDATVKLWHYSCVGTKATISQTEVVICEHETEVRAVDLSLSGVFVASCSSSGQIFVHEVESHKVRATMQMDAMVTAVRFVERKRLGEAGQRRRDRSPSDNDLGFKLAAVTTAGTLALYNSFGQPVFLQQSRFDFRSVAVLGDMLVTGGVDGIVRCWTQSGGEEMLWSNGEAKDVSDVVSSLRATSNGEMLLAGTDAGKVCVWRVKYNR